MTERLTDAQRFERAITEDEVQTKIVGAIQTFRGQVFHDKAVNIARGGNPAGWPDVFGALPNGWLIVIECKNWNRKVTDDQIEWLLDIYGANPDERAKTRSYDHTRAAWAFFDTDMRRLVGVARPSNVDRLVDAIIRFGQQPAPDQGATA